VSCAPNFHHSEYNCGPRGCAGAIDVREFPAVTAKAKITVAGLLYSSIGGYRHADNIIAGRSLTGDAVAL